MTKQRRSIFLLNGRKEHWLMGKMKSVWGLPMKNLKWLNVQARLQEISFIPGAEILAISGPLAHFRAVIGSDKGVYLDSDSTPFIFGPGKETYPVRIELTNIQDINKYWYIGAQGNEWRGPLDDMYFSRNSLYTDRNDLRGDSRIDWTVIYGTPYTSVEPTQSSTGSSESLVSDPQLLEDITADLFSNIGFRVEQLGYRYSYERVPDGLASLPRSLTDYLKQMGQRPFFILWDCKFNCGQSGLTANEERAIREYISDFAQKKKHELMAPEFWFLIVGQTPSATHHIHIAINRATWPDDTREVGCRGIRSVSLDWLRSVAEKASAFRRGGGDPDHFLIHELPKMLKDLIST